MSFAQNADETKKIESRLAAETDPQKKLAIYLELLDAVGDYDSVATEKYVKEALPLADRLKDKKSKLEIYRQQGIMLMNFDDVPKALPLLNKSLELALTTNTPIKVGDIYNNISNAYMQINNTKLTDEYIFKALKVYQEQNSEADVALAYANIGSNYSRRADYPKAIEYLLKSITIRERLHNDRGVGFAAFNITLPYKFLKRYDEALRYNQLAIDKFTLIKNEGQLAAAYAVKGSILRSLKKYDEALSYISKALPLFEKYKNSAGIRNSYDNMGLLYVAKNDLTNAMKYFMMSKQISLKLNAPNGIVSADVNIAQTALDLDDLPKVEATLNEAEPLAKKYNLKMIARALQRRSIIIWL